MICPHIISCAHFHYLILKGLGNCHINSNVCVFSQINMLLNFKDEKQDCPCPEDIREQLLDFHEDLMTHCGKGFAVSVIQTSLNQDELEKLNRIIKMYL